MFSFSSYFNRQSLTLIGLIVILLSIPLTAMLAQKAQELRGRAAPSGEVIFTDANGNPLGQTTTSQGVHLKIIPPDGWQFAQSPSLNLNAENIFIANTYAQEEACVGGWSSTNCSLNDQSPCNDYGNPTYCGWNQDLWNACQQRCTPTSTPPPQPTATPVPATPTPAASSCTPNGQIDTRRHCRPGTTEMCTYNVWRGSDCSTGEGDPYNCQDSSECGYQPPAGPTVLRQIYIQNKDGGSGGHEPARITGADLNPYKKGSFLLVPWKLTDGVGQKTVQVDFYEQPDNDSAGRRTRTASIQLTQPTAPPAAGGVDVGRCESIAIDGQPFADDVPASKNPFILAGKTHDVRIKMVNEKVGVPQNSWDSNYSLKYVGTSGDRLGLSTKQISVGSAQCNKVPVEANGYCFFDFKFTPTLPSDRDNVDYEFFWQMHNANNQPSFEKGSGQCVPKIQVNATLPGVSPTPGAPGTCPTDSTHFCSTDVSKLPGGGGGCTRTTESFTCANDPNTGFQQSCFYCPPTTPTPTLTPTPTEVPSRCEGAGLECSLDDPTATGRRDPNQYACRDIGRLNCSSPQRCWACTIRTGPTPTSTPPPGAPTISPIPPGSTVIPIQVALQEFVKAPQTREGKAPASSRRTRTDTEVRLVPTTGTPFNTKITLTWKEERVGPNLGFFEGNIVFAPGLLPTGTYNILVKEPNHLRKTIASAVSITSGGVNPTVDGRANPLTVGDADGDNSINGADFAMVVRCLAENVQRNLTQCSNRDKDADFDGDGTGTIFDYNWLAENFGKTGEP